MTKHTPFARPATCALAAAALTIAAMVLAPGAEAQVYKHVGPDGKTVYTDRPTDAASAKPKASDAKPTDARGQAIGSSGDGIAGFNDTKNPIRAAGVIAGAEAAVEAVTALCAREVPDAAGTVRKAQTKWLSDHAGMISRKNDIMNSTMSSSERADMNSLVARQARRSVIQLESGTEAQKRGICQALPNKLDQPEFAPRHNPNFLTALNAALPQKR